MTEKSTERFTLRVRTSTLHRLRVACARKRSKMQAVAGRRVDALLLRIAERLESENEESPETAQSSQGSERPRQRRTADDSR